MRSAGHAVLVLLASGGSVSVLAGAVVLMRGVVAIDAVSDGVEFPLEAGAALGVFTALVAILSKVSDALLRWVGAVSIPIGAAVAAGLFLGADSSR